MKQFIFSFLLSICLAVTSCGFPDEPKDTVREITMMVSAETGVTYNLFDTYGEHPIECMLVKYGKDSDRWQPFSFSAIEGFTYERGHEYILRVRMTTLANPPADGSCFTFALVRILSDVIVE